MTTNPNNNNDEYNKNANNAFFIFPHRKQHTVNRVNFKCDCVYAYAYMRERQTEREAERKRQRNTERERRICQVP